MAWQEVIIHEILEETNEQFFRQIAEGAVARHNPQMPFIPPSVNWANGLAFINQGFPDTDDIIKDKLIGKVHYGAVIFTRLDFRENYPCKVGSETVNVRMEKATNPIFLDMAGYLKDFKQDSRVAKMLR
jgi:hypothetical protein